MGIKANIKVLKYNYNLTSGSESSISHCFETILQVGVKSLLLIFLSKTFDIFFLPMPSFIPSFVLPVTILHSALPFSPSFVLFVLYSYFSLPTSVLTFVNQFVQLFSVVNGG